MMKTLLLTLALGIAFVATPLQAQTNVQGKEVKRTPLTQEEKEERALEEVYGVEVERDRAQRSPGDNSVFDRYGSGTVGTFQNQSNARNLEDNDAMGVNIRLFEFK
tara:strand:- start:165 stop:482 length:318 start_codon:yes stop_codon:yes gene_type:complete